MKSLALYLGLLSSVSGYAQERFATSGMPVFNIGEAYELKNPGDLARLTDAQVRLHLIQKEIQQISNKAPAAFSSGKLKGLCNDYVSGKNLLIGADALRDHWKIQNEFASARSVLDQMGLAFGCTGTAPVPVPVPVPPAPSYPTGWFNVNIQNVGDAAYCLNLQSYGSGQMNNIYQCGRNADQAWDIAPLSQNTYRVRSIKYQSCLNLQYGADYTETNVYACESHPDQTWKINQLGNGTYQIESVRAPGKCLSLNNHYNEAHTVVTSCDRNNTTQAWRFY